MNLSVITDAHRDEDFFILSRYLYRFGIYLMSDDVYSSMEKYFKQEGILEEYTSRTYDDDPVPVHLLKEIDATEYIPDMRIESKYAEYLNSEKTTSIRPVTTYEEAFSFVQAMQGQDLIASLKVDGVSSKTLYPLKSNSLAHQYELTISRARDAKECLDYTKGGAHIFPASVSEDNRSHIIVYAEIFVHPQYLAYLKKKYSEDKYKTAKSAAISLLRVKYDSSDYKYLYGFTFNADGITGVNTLSEKLTKLKSLGFMTVPFVVIKNEQIPKDFENFKEFIKRLCQRFYDSTKNIPSDGLVLEVNDLNYETVQNNQYLNRNIALKLANWEAKKYVGVVEDIVLEQQRCVASCRIKIKTLKTDDGCSATWLNGFNPSILISQGITIGSKVIFERKSGTINTLVGKY